MRKSTAFLLAAVFVLGASFFTSSRAAQSVRITRINDVAVPPDQVFVPYPSDQLFEIEWAAEDTDCFDGVVTMELYVDNVIQPSIAGSGFSGVVTLDQDNFPSQDCLHNVQIRAFFHRKTVFPPSCLTLTPGVYSSANQFWSTRYRDCTGPEDCNKSTVGKPVDVSTGRMYHEMTDMTVQGPLPIVFARRYDSTSTFEGPLGYGWRHGYLMSVESAGTNRRVFVDRQGRRVYFAQNAQGGWEKSRIENLSLTAPGGPDWRVTDPRQMKYDFDAAGMLTQITDRHTNTLTFGYTGSNLTSVTDAFGRTVSLAYDPSDRLQTISAGARTVTYSYDGANNLERVDYPDGSFVTYEYNDPADPHNMTAARDALGRLIESHTYDVTDRVTHTESAAGNEAFDISYDSATQTTVTNSLAEDTVYTHDDFNGLVTSSNGPGCASCGGGGASASLTYDRLLNLVELQDGRGVRTQMTHDPNGNVLTRTEAVGTPVERTWTFEYDPTFNLPVTTRVPSVGACANADRTVANTYNGTGDLVTQEVTGCNDVDTFTHTTTFTYDGHGQVKTIDGPRSDVADVTTYDYYADGDADLGRRGRLTRVTDALGHETLRDGYDLFGNVGSVTDANSVETTFQYDPSDRVTETRLVGAVPADDLVTLRQYDTVGNLDFVRRPECVETGAGCAFSLDYTYDEVNRLSEIVDPFGNRAIYTHDTEGNRTREEYRDAGDVIRRFSNFAYDSLNRLQYVYFNDILPENPGSVFVKLGYDASGNRVSLVDPEGHTTTYVYDELRQLRSATRTVGLDNLVTSYDYDVQGHLTSLTDPLGLVTDYRYNDEGWRLEATSPDAGTTSDEYDPAGNRTSSAKADGVVVIHSYDALNRLSDVSYPDSTLNVTHSYDSAVVGFGVGRLTGTTDASGSTTLHYDRAGRMTREEKILDGITYTTEYDYDRNGNPTRIVYPTDDPGVHQGQADLVYDAADRVSDVSATVNGNPTTVAGAILYQPFGPRVGLTFGNGLADTRTYDSRYQQVGWTLGGLLSLSDGYDGDGILVSRTDNLNAANDRSFVYDPAHRLVGASGPWGAGTACAGGATYTYDPNGNRLCKGPGAASTDYVYTAGTNLLESTSGAEPASYTYDANGNMLGDGTHDYAYSDADRLVLVDAGATATYTYDAAGRRVIKDAGGVTTHYLYDPSGRLLSEVRPADGSGSDYLYLEDVPLARVDWGAAEVDLGNVLTVSKQAPNVHLDWSAFPAGGNEYVIRRKEIVDPADRSFDGNIVLDTVLDPVQSYDDPVLGDAKDYAYRVFRQGAGDTLYFYHADHLGTPLAMTDTGAGAVWRAEHLPFGPVESFTVEDVPNPLRFPGQYADAEVPLFYNVHRWYDGSTGRYTRPDPLGRRGGPHPYVYVVNNPINLVDALGLKVELRCRPVGSPQGKLGFKVWAARNIAGATHCFLDVSCAESNIPQTTVSYLGNGPNVVRNGSGVTNNDTQYSDGGRFDPYPVKTPPQCEPCQFERCIIRLATILEQKDFRIENYSVIGPNSNSYAQRLIRECGGKLGVPVSSVDGAYGIESPWNIELPE